MSNEFENQDNSSTLANDLFTALTAGVTIPPSPDFSDAKYDITPDQTSDLYSDITGAILPEVTAGKGTLDGTGAFDVFMQAMDKHLEREFKGNRLTGSQYAEVYTAVANQTMGQAVSFVLQKEQSRWAAVTAQMQARIAEIQATQALVELEKAKIETAQSNFQLNLTAAQYALTKMQTATEEAQHDSVTADVAIKQFQRNYQQPADLAITHYERTAVMPSSVAMNVFQTDRILPAQAAIAEYQNRVLQPLEADIQQHILNQRMPQETALIKEQVETQRANTLETRTDGLTPVQGVIDLQKRNLIADAAIKDYNLVNTLPRQMDLLDEQIILTTEQGEAERAKTLDTRADGATVEGSVGKQKDLYDQQIDSFIKDAQHKTAKMFLDSWITRKTLDIGVPVPSEFSETNVSNVFNNVRTNNNI